jgi:dienelactone hydrolase
MTVMAGMYGADVAELRELARAFDAAATKLDRERMSVGNAIRLPAWVGPVAVRFRAEWDSEHSTRVSSAAARLKDAAFALRRNADEQERTSAPDSGSGSTLPPSRGEREHGASRSTLGSAHALVTELDGMEKNQDGLRIQKIVGDDGVERYVVYINGSGSTSDGAWGGDLGWDNNAFAVVSFDNRTLDHIRAKIASVVEPDAEVALVGFSQGGLIAQRLADESAFRCTTVLTYGSPVLHDVRNFGGADVIRLEHDSDIVPRLSLFNPLHDPLVAVMDAATGNTPPAPGEEVTYRDGGLRWDVHNSGKYGDLAARFDASSDPRYDAAKAALGRFSGRIVADER